MGASTSTFVADDERNDVDRANLNKVRTATWAIYGTGLGLWVLGFAIFFIYLFRNHTYQATGSNAQTFMSKCFPYIAGFLFGILLLGLNLGIASTQETIGDYANEKAEYEELAKTSFYLVAAIFAFGQVLLDLNKKVVRAVLPLLMLVVFFSVALVLPVIWVSTVDATQTIYLKHTKTVFSSYGFAFMVAVLAIIFFRRHDLVATVAPIHIEG